MWNGQIKILQCVVNVKCGTYMNICLILKRERGQWWIWNTILCSILTIQNRSALFVLHFHFSLARQNKIMKILNPKLILARKRKSSFFVQYFIIAISKQKVRCVEFVQDSRTNAVRSFDEQYFCCNKNLYWDQRFLLQNGSPWFPLSSALSFGAWIPYTGALCFAVF